MEKKALATKDEAALKRSVIAAAPAGSVTGYVLVTLEPSANLPDVYRTLYSLGSVLFCDAIKGDYDMVLLVHAASNEKIREIVKKEIKAVPGVAVRRFFSWRPPYWERRGRHHRVRANAAAEEGKPYTERTARDGASSYVMLEIEKEKLEAIYPVLYFNDQVVYCDFTRGKYDIVALMKGTGFAEIENTIRNKFKPLDGVLRIKEWPDNHAV